MVSARSWRPWRWFSARAVRTRWTSAPWAASAAAAAHAVGGQRRRRRSGRRGRRWSPRSSSRPGRRPRPRPTVPATAVGSSPKPFSRSADTGRSVASTMARAWASASVSRDRPVETAEGGGEPAARRGQGVETERGQEPGRADVPGLGSSSGLPGTWRERNRRPCRSGSPRSRRYRRRSSAPDRQCAAVKPMVACSDVTVRA